MGSGALSLLCGGEESKHSCSLHQWITYPVKYLEAILQQMTVCEISNLDVS